MTDHHAELSRRLALALGHPSDDMRNHAGHLWVRDYGVGIGRLAWSDDPPLLPWRRFDYRDPAVIWPIAERYNCFPMRSAWTGAWSASMYDDLSDLGKMVCDTAAEAVARAVVVGARG